MKSFLSLTLKLVVATLILSAASAHAQLPSYGRDFYLANVSSSMTCVAMQAYQSQWILISSPYGCKATISYFNQTTGEEYAEHTYTIGAKSSMPIPVDMSAAIVYDSTVKPLHPNGEIPEYTAIHVHTDNIATVSYLGSGPDNGVLYFALPLHALGKTYIVAAAPSNDGTGGIVPRLCSGPVEPASSCFSIIAVADSTHVTIRPSGTTRTWTPGATSGPLNGHGNPTPISITLMRGQVYTLKSLIDTTVANGGIDMTGSQIDADQPIGVVAGSENTLNGYSGLGIADMRNLTAQMQIPYEYWATKDYLTMPLADAPDLDPGNASAGDQLKIFVRDKTPIKCGILTDLGNLGTRSNSAAPYQFPPLILDNIQTGTATSSECGQKISVEQYDYRATGNAQNRMVTAPTQFNVVPYQNYARSFSWFVPDDAMLRSQARFQYLNVISRQDQITKIKLYKDGKYIGSISSLPSAGTTTIPGHPELKGYRYQIGVGSYFAIGDSSFMIYEQGTAGADIPDKDLSDFDNDDHFWAYASALGQTFGSASASSPSVAVDTICDGRPYWSLHVRDTAQSDGAIAAIDILNDSLGLIKRNGSGGSVSSNVYFEPSNFAITPGTRKTADVKILVRNPMEKADAWIWVANGAGGDTLSHITYTPPSLTFGAVTSDGIDANGDARLDFKNVQVALDTCSQFVLKNTGAPGSQTYHLSNIRFQLGGQGFTAKAVDANHNSVTLPAILSPGDSVIIQVCFNIDGIGVTAADTLFAETECPAAIGYLTGSTTLPIIVATDHDFGSVRVGATASSNVRVTNTGGAPFTLTKEWLVTTYLGSAAFHVNDAMLPRSLAPRDFIEIPVSYTPIADGVIDSSILTWGTDIAEGYKTDKKNYSILTGYGIRPALEWEPGMLGFVAACDSSQTKRIYLMAEGTAGTVIDSLRIVGPTKSQWKIATQNGRTETFVIGATLPDSLWVDVTFTPDSAYGCNGLDTLIAYDEAHIFPVARLFGNRVAGVRNLPASRFAVSITPNPAQSNATISISGHHSASVTIEVLDLLGNSVMHFTSDASQMPIDLKSLSSGVYFVRISDGNSVETRRLVRE